MQGVPGAISIIPDECMTVEVPNKINHVFRPYYVVAVVDVCISIDDYILVYRIVI